uniref:Ephrin RBD domain-containing protein n=1 Tax=Haemonchus contortus TaxID=6289 RepID=A0A7I4YCC5_HAECO
MAVRKGTEMNHRATPQTGCPEYKKDKFYLTMPLDQSSRDYFTIIAGDDRAKKGFCTSDTPSALLSSTSIQTPIKQQHLCYRMLKVGGRCLLRLTKEKIQKTELYTRGRSRVKNDGGGNRGKVRLCCMYVTTFLLVAAKQFCGA